MAHTRHSSGNRKEHHDAKVDLAREMMLQGASRSQIFLALTTRFGSALESTEFSHLRAGVMTDQQRDEAVRAMHPEEVLIMFPPPTLPGLPAADLRVICSPHRPYTDEQRLDILIFADEQGDDAACQRFGITPKRLRKWQVEAAAPIEEPSMQTEEPPITPPDVDVFDEDESADADADTDAAALNETDGDRLSRADIAQAKIDFTIQLIKTCPWSSNGWIHRGVRSHFAALGFAVKGIGGTRITELRREIMPADQYAAWHRHQGRMRGITRSERGRATSRRTEPVRTPVVAMTVGTVPDLSPEEALAAAAAAVAECVRNAGFAGATITVQGDDPPDIEVTEMVPKKRKL